MARAREVYPMWKFYPSAIEPPVWVSPVVAAFACGPAADRLEAERRAVE